MAKIKTKTERVDRAIYLKSGSHWVVKRQKWHGPFKTVGDARKERDRIEKVQAPKPAGGPLADFYYRQYKPKYLMNMKENTIRAQSSAYENSILPYFKGKALTGITKNDVLDFRVSLQNNLVAETINMRITLLKSLFRAAIELGFLSENPCADIKYLSLKMKDRKTLSEKELIELVKSINHPYKYAIALAGLAGARAGEVIGFKWQDFKFLENGKGSITFARQINNAHHIDELKSKAANSTLPMVNPLTQFMREWKEDCPDDEWLFQHKAKVYIAKIYRELKYKYHRQPRSSKFEFTNGSNLIGWWNSTAKRNYEIPQKMRFHDLRHSFATNIVNRCQNVKLAQRLCRHANINTTLEIYTHVRPEHFDEVYEWTF